jgi:muramoyltetrapeptide carboxypeptidase LdcA involved in peptidoglycan recycling
MIKPKPLSTGDTIAFITLSSGMAGEEIFQYRWEIAKKRLEALGYRVVLTPNAIQSSEYIHRHPEKRAQDLMDALQNPEIDAIICMIGGSDTIRLLPYIDFEIIANYPKLFVGYSDTTINHFMFYHANVASIYGPTALVEFAENKNIHEYTLTHFLELVAGEKSSIPLIASPQWTSEFLDWTNPKNAEIRRTMQKEQHFHEFLQGEGVVQGKLLGGCLETFPMMIGTKIWPQLEEWKGKVLFIETSELSLPPSLFAIILRGLAAQGIFHQIAGILMGKPVNEQFYEEYKSSLIQIISEECRLEDLPIVYNLNFGHTAPIMSLPIGCTIEIDCMKKSLILLESPVK